jgi:hypothetical protein
MDLPSSETTLARNLEYLLRVFMQSDAVVEDVLLYIPASDAQRPRVVVPDHFRLVVLKCEDLEGPGFVELKPRGGPTAPAPEELSRELAGG